MVFVLRKLLLVNADFLAPLALQFDTVSKPLIERQQKTVDRIGGIPLDKIIIVFLGQEHTDLLITHNTVAENMAAQALQVLFQLRCKEHLALPRKSR